MANVFVHHDGALGDVLLSLPCLAALRAEAGGLHLAARPDVARLLKETGCVDDAVSSDNGLFGRLYGGVADGRARDFLSRFERAFVFTALADSPLSATVASVVPDTRTIRTLPPAGERTHVADFRFRRLGAGRTFPNGPLLKPPRTVQSLAEAYLERTGCDGRRPLIAVHPGSGGRSKCWPPERFEQLIVSLEREQSAFIVAVTGPAEEGPLAERMERFSRSMKRVFHLRNAELPIVAAVLARSRIFVGNDSGISHLAAATGCPSVVLFGPTDPGLWKPKGDRVRILASASLDEITVNRVMKTIRLLRSSPAGREGPPAHDERERGRANGS